MNFEFLIGNLTCKYAKRFWPHIEHTGGFFASIFQKKATPFAKGDENSEGKKEDFVPGNPQSRSSTAPSQRSFHYPVLAAQGQKNLIVKPATKGEWEIVERFVSKHLQSKLRDGFLYLTKDGVYFNQKNLGPLSEYFYFVHGGTRIGSIKGNTFIPTHHIYWCISDTKNIPTFSLTREQWVQFQNKKKVDFELADGYYIALYGRGIVGIVAIENGTFVAKSLS